MAAVAMRKHFGSLRPLDEAGEELLSKIKNGDDVMVEVKKPRNIRHHRLFFGLVNLIFQNQEGYDSKEDLLNALKIAAGHYTLLTLPNGSQHKVPKSISFEKMDQIQFNDFYDNVCKVAIKYWFPTVGSEELKQEVLDMIG